MQSVYNILLGVFRYNESDSENHLYGIITVDTEKLDYTVRYLGEEELLEAYSKSPDNFDFDIKDSMVYSRGKPVPIDNNTALRTKNFNMGMQLSSSSYYSMLWYFVRNGFYYVPENSPFISGNPKTFSSKGLSKFLNLYFPEDSLGVYLRYRDSKGSESQVPLLTMMGQPESFKVLTTDDSLPEIFLEHMTLFRTVKIGKTEYKIYSVNILGTYIPSMQSLGQYIPNLVCFLKTMTDRYKALVYSIDRVISHKAKEIGTPTMVDILNSFVNIPADTSIKVNYTIDTNLEVLRLVVDDMVLNPEKLEISIQSRIKELNEVEKFVIINLVQFKDVTSTAMGYLYQLLSWREKVQEQLNFFEIMLMIQRASLTSNKPSAINLKREGICGLTKGKTSVGE